MGGCQNYGRLLAPLNTKCSIVLRTQKGTIISARIFWGSRYSPSLCYAGQFLLSLGLPGRRGRQIRCSTGLGSNELTLNSSYRWEYATASVARHSWKHSGFLLDTKMFTSSPGSFDHTPTEGSALLCTLQLENGR